MTLYDAITLGGVQGITEFFPISSSGHLVLVQYWLGLRESMLVFDIVVHWGTLAAIFLYFRKEILSLISDSFFYVLKYAGHPDREQLSKKYPYALTAGFLVVSMIPTVVMAILFREIFEASFRSVLTVGLAWLVMGLFLVVSRRWKGDARPLASMSHLDAFAIGAAQGMALIPGISRSGATILMALYCGLSKHDAIRYAFLLAIPAIVGAGILKWQEAFLLWQQQPSIFLSGVASAAVIGYLALFLLVRLVERGRLHYFGYYCILIGLFSVVSNFL